MSAKPLASLPGFVLAGQVTALKRDCQVPPRPGAIPHKHGSGPFAELKLPPVDPGQGVFVLVHKSHVLFIGATRTRDLNNYLMDFRTITSGNIANTGQITTCRVNAAANRLLRTSAVVLELWYRSLAPGQGPAEKDAWIEKNGPPCWNWTS